MWIREAFPYRACPVLSPERSVCGFSFSLTGLVFNSRNFSEGGEFDTSLRRFYLSCLQIYGSCSAE